MLYAKDKYLVLQKDEIPLRLGKVRQGLASSKVEHLVIADPDIKHRPVLKYLLISLDSLAEVSKACKPQYLEQINALLKTTHWEANLADEYGLIKDNILYAVYTTVEDAPEVQEWLGIGDDYREIEYGEYVTYQLRY